MQLDAVASESSPGKTKSKKSQLKSMICLRKQTYKSQNIPRTFLLEINKLPVSTFASE